MNLLSVDWDFFYPDENENWNLWDWGHRETGLMIDTIWKFRAEAFIRAGRSLPTTSGEEGNFWPRFRFSPDCRLFYGESHALAALREVEAPIKRVVSFDAHHDCGYRSLSQVLKTLGLGRIHCEDWLLFYKLTNRRVEVVYPRWKTWAFEDEAEPASPVHRYLDTSRSFKKVLFHRVFVCRSGAWVPPWCDTAYEKFIAGCPVKHKTQLGETIQRSFEAEVHKEKEDVVLLKGKIT